MIEVKQISTGVIVFSARSEEELSSFLETIEELSPSDLSDIEYADSLAAFRSQQELVNLPNLTRAQFKSVVDLVDGLEAAINAAIAAIPDPVTKVIVSNRFNLSESYEASDPLFEQLLPAVNLSRDEFITLWQWAATL